MSHITYPSNASDLYLLSNDTNTVILSTRVQVVPEKDGQHKNSILQEILIKSNQTQMSN